MRVFIDKQGDVQYVHSDEMVDIPLGKKVINRASNVEFDNEKQEWQAKLVATDQVIASGKRRDEVIRQEIIEIEGRLRNGTFTQL